MCYLQDRKLLSYEVSIFKLFMCYINILLKLFHEHGCMDGLLDHSYCGIVHYLLLNAIWKLNLKIYLHSLSVEERRLSNHLLELFMASIRDFTFYSTTNFIHYLICSFRLVGKKCIIKSTKNQPFPPLKILIYLFRCTNKIVNN